MENNQLFNMDVLSFLRQIPDGSVDLVLTDPPYNIGRDKWDRIENYFEWCRIWIREAGRILTGIGSLYIWHSEFKSIMRLVEIAEEEGFTFRQQCIFVKPNFRALSWKDPKTSTLRNWFNICEYCLYFIAGADDGPPPTGLEMINSNPECYKPLKDWYNSEMQRLGITKQEILEKYRKETGKSGACGSSTRISTDTRTPWTKITATSGIARNGQERKAPDSCTAARSPWTSWSGSSAPARGKGRRSWICSAVPGPRPWRPTTQAGGISSTREIERPFYRCGGGSVRMRHKYPSTNIYSNKTRKKERGRKMIKPEEIEAVRRSVKPGQYMRITTRVCDGPSDDRVIRTDAVIDGCYKHGIIVSFRHYNRLGEGLWLRRWIAYVDILQSKGKKSVYASTGKKGEYYFVGKKRRS